MFQFRSCLVWMLGLVVLAWIGGCSREPHATQSPPADASVAQHAASQTDADYVFEAPIYEANAEQLLAARLPIEQTSQGWIRLFDGHTLFGWAIAGKANWRIEGGEDGMGEIAVDRGKPCLLTTTTRWSDFELELQFKTDEETNSGVFVRTNMEPQDLETDCFEINIAPPDNPFPTGSVVKRKKAQPYNGKADQWHNLNVLCDASSLVIKVDDAVLCEMDNAEVPRSGFIGLQYNSGAVRFRDVRLRPIGMTDLLDDSLSLWKRYEDMPGEFKVNDEGHLVVEGGKQQLESLHQYGDFTMLVDYQMNDPKSNSGVFFRSIPGDVMMGYECQVNNEMLDGNPLMPADCGAGGIFKRQDARIVAGEPNRWNSILLSADGSHFAGWVNGLQVTDVFDDRPPHENPRKGLRLEPGTLIIQGHDPTTRATFRKIAVQD